MVLLNIINYQYFIKIDHYKQIKYYNALYKIIYFIIKYIVMVEKLEEIIQLKDEYDRLFDNCISKINNIFDDNLRSTLINNNELLLQNINLVLNDGLLLINKLNNNLIETENNNSQIKLNFDEAELNQKIMTTFLIPLMMLYKNDIMNEFNIGISNDYF